MTGTVEAMTISSVDLIKPGNERLARLSSLFQTDYDALLRFAYLVCGDRSVAQDLVQEAFVRVWRAGRRAEATNPGAYARSTIVNLARSRFRHASVERRALPTIAERGVVQPHDPGARDEIWVAMHELSPRERACVALRYYEDMTEQQTADALGVSAGTVKSLMSRAMTKLRAALGDRSEV